MLREEELPKGVTIEGRVPGVSLRATAVPEVQPQELGDSPGGARTIISKPGKDFFLNLVFVSLRIAVISSALFQEVFLGSHGLPLAFSQLREMKLPKHYL